MSDIKRPSIEAVEKEIQRERAEALGRAGERLEEALAVLRALREELEGVGGDPLGGSGGLETGGRLQGDRRMARYRAWYARVVELRHHLIIQREAVGLRRHEEVDRHFPIPPDLPPGAVPERREPR